LTLLINTILIKLNNNNKYKQKNLIILENQIQVKNIFCKLYKNCLILNKGLHSSSSTK